jgi:hypothetical protein
MKSGGKSSRSDNVVVDATRDGIWPLCEELAGRDLNPGWQG